MGVYKSQRIIQVMKSGWSFENTARYPIVEILVDNPFVFISSYVIFERYTEIDTEKKERKVDAFTFPR